MQEIIRMLSLFEPIGLDEMDSVRLMNRMDTKYVLSVSRIPELLSRLDGEYRVLEINNFRNLPYTTTYLDTCEHLFFNQHVTGKLERNKVRYRRYETTGTTYLEVKKTTNKNRTIKWRIENSLTSDNGCDDVAYDFIKEYVLQKSLILQTTLINRFNRITLVGNNYNERVTIDYNISFSGINGRHSKIPSISIIEVKRDGFSYRSMVANILKDFNIHSTGFSKYCIGSALTYDLLRKNILKRKLLLINKIENDSIRLNS